jgi:hypothetical protein
MAHPRSPWIDGLLEPSQPLHGSAQRGVTLNVIVSMVLRRYQHA